MTTIAYNHKDREIAIDGRITAGTVIITERFDKVIRNDYGTWFMCGCSADYSEYSKLVHNKKIDNVDNEPDCGALIIRDGKCFNTYISENGFFKIIQEKDNIALGSGRWLALAAMDLGKTAKEAVEYAATRDNCTGANIWSFSLDDLSD